MKNIKFNLTKILNNLNTKIDSHEELNYYLMKIRSLLETEALSTFVTIKNL